MSTLSIIVIALVLMISLYTDIKSYKIKNIITVPTALVATIIALIFYPITQVLLYVVVLFGIGFIGWLLGLWKAGDVKISLAIGMWAIFILGEAQLLFVLFYYLAFILTHLAIGHFLILKSCKFHPIRYLKTLVTPANIVYGRLPATITIMCSFVLVILLF